MKPVVSVIMPFFNAERHLADAIESVLAQTLTEWELLLIDDGSQDTSASIAMQFLHSEPRRIKLLRHPRNENHGPAAARNLGLAHATGEFIAFLDADDLFMPEKLASETLALTSAPDAAMLYGPTYWWWENGKDIDQFEEMGVATEHIYAPPALVTEIILGRKGATPCTCGVLIRRDAIMAVGGFETRFRLYEDQVLWTKLFLRYPIYVSSQCFARYRQHAASASELAQQAGSYHRWKPHPARLAFLQWMEAHIVQSGIIDTHLTKAMDLALMPYRHPFRWFINRVTRKIVRGFSRGSKSRSRTLSGS